MSFFVDITLALYAERSDSVAGYLGKKSAGNTFDSEGESYVFKGTFVTKAFEHCNIVRSFFVGHSVKKFVCAGIAVTKSCRSGNCFFWIGGMAKKIDFHNGAS